MDQFDIAAAKVAKTPLVWFVFHASPDGRFITGSASLEGNTLRVARANGRSKRREVGPYPPDELAKLILSELDVEEARERLRISADEG